MKNMFHLISFLPLILSLTALHSPQVLASPNDTTTLITNACKNSPSTENCMKFLNSAPPNQKTNLKGLAFFALKLAEKDAARTTLHIKKMAQNQDLPPFLQQAFSDCRQHYTSLVELINDSIEEAVSENAFSNVKKLVNAATADAEACRESLGIENSDSSSAEMLMEKKAIEIDIEALKFLLDIALSIATAGDQN